MAKKPTKKTARPTTKKTVTAKAKTKKARAKAAPKARAKAATATKTVAKATTRATEAVLRAAAALDWDRASGGRIDNIAKLLTDLVTGKPAARRKAFDALHEAFVNRPFACVVAPFLVDLAVTGGARVDALRLLAAAREAVSNRESWRSSQRTIAAIAPIADHIRAFLADADPAVRAAAADTAGAAQVPPQEIVDALERETDARVKACLLLALPAAELDRATPFVDDIELGIAAAAACVLTRPDAPVESRVLDVLERALADEELDSFPWPDRSVRAFALARLAALAQPELRDRLAAIYTSLLTQPPAPLATAALLRLAFPEKPATFTPFQKDVLRRCMMASEETAKIVTSLATELGLPYRPETLRRLADIREPVPAGSVFAIELTIGQETDTAYGFWKTFTGTGQGSARALLDGVAAALSPREAARAVLEASTLGSIASFEGTMSPPPLPDGGVLGAKDNWESWTIYKTKSRSEVAAAYARQLADDGWQIIGFCDFPGDARILAQRDGIQVDGTFYDEGAGACVSIDAEPWLFASLVETLYQKHGKAFADAFADALRPLAADKDLQRPYGNLGYHVSIAAVQISNLSGHPPDPVCDSFVAEHQAGRNVLLPYHIKYLSLVAPERRTAMVCTIVGGEGKFLELARIDSSPAVLSAAAEGLRHDLSSYRSGYDDARRIAMARDWAFLGDYAVDTIKKSLAADKVGNPDIAVTILIEIGTPAARAALGKLAKHPDKKVQKIVQAALSS